MTPLDRRCVLALAALQLAVVAVVMPRGNFPLADDWTYAHSVLALRSGSPPAATGGYLLLAVPSNPREWRWDDDFYGHVRRYTTDELGAKLAAAGMPALTFWDFTFPIFWAMRRVYTRIRAPRRGGEDRASATRASASVNAWDLPVVSKVLDASAALWYPLHRAQFRLFRNAVGRGHEFFALAQKPLT